MASHSKHKAQITVTAKDKTRGSLKRVAGQVAAIGAAYMGWQAVTGILKGIVDVGINHEKVWNDVASALKRHDKEVNTNLKSIQQFADEMQTLSGESDETIGKMVQGFVDYGQTVEQAMDTTKVAMDLAAGGGMNLMSATDLLSKAAVGYTSTLSRYGIIIDENIPKSEKFAAAIEQINERFGGAAAARADTMAVKMALVAEKIGDLGEQLFKLFAPALLGGISSMISIVGSVTNVITRLVEGVPPVTRVTEEATLKFKSWSDETDRLMRSLNDGTISVDEFRVAVANVGKTITKVSPSTREEVEMWINYADAMAQVADAVRVAIPGMEAMYDAQQAQLAQEALKAKQEEAAKLADLHESIANMERETAATRLQIMTESNDEIEEEFRADSAELFEATRQKLAELEEINRLHDQTKAEIRRLGLEAEYIGMSEHNAAMLELKLMHEQELAAIDEDVKLTNDQRREAEQALDIIYANEEKKIHETKLKELQAMYKQRWQFIADGATTVARKMSTIIVTDTKNMGKQMKEVFKQVGRAIVAHIAESAVKAIFDLITAQVAQRAANVLEIASVKAVTLSYISLAAAKSAASLGMSTGASLAGAAATKGGLIPMLMTGFDDPLNDAVAMRHGRDYATNFLAGMSDKWDSPGFGHFVTDNLPEPSAPSGGATNINIEINGNVIADDDWVSDTLTPAIERAVQSGRSLLALQDDNLTGSTEVGFA